MSFRYSGSPPERISTGLATSAIWSISPNDSSVVNSTWERSASGTARQCWHRRLQALVVSQNIRRKGGAAIETVIDKHPLITAAGSRRRQSAPAVTRWRIAGQSVALPPFFFVNAIADFTSPNAK